MKEKRGQRARKISYASLSVWIRASQLLWESVRDVTNCCSSCIIYSLPTGLFNRRERLNKDFLHLFHLYAYSEILWPICKCLVPTQTCHLDLAKLCASFEKKPASKSLSFRFVLAARRPSSCNHLVRDMIRQKYRIEVSMQSKHSPCAYSIILRLLRLTSHGPAL